MTLDLIAPFLPAPVQHALADPTLSEIMLCAGRCFIERDGALSQLETVTTDQRSLLIACRHIARSLAQELSSDDPVCESRLADGSRVAIIIPPVAVDGVVLTIRKFHPNWFSLDELVKIGTLNQHQANWLVEQLLNRNNVLIAGSTGSGKTTLLKSLADLIPSNERLIVIEETTEMPLSHLNLVRVEARHVTVGAMVSASLRHRPDRVIVGEVRGSEAFDLLDALNTGHGGSLCTIHANSAARALDRLCTCVLKGDTDMLLLAVQREVSMAIQVVVHLKRQGGKRIISEIATVDRFDGRRFILSDPFKN